MINDVNFKIVSKRKQEYRKEKIKSNKEHKKNINADKKQES